MISIAEDSTHKNRRDTAAIVRLRCEVDDSNHCSNENVQAGASHTCRGANVDWEANEVFDGSSAVEDNEYGQDDRADDGCDHTVPPQETNGNERGTEIVAAWAEGHGQIVGEVVLPLPFPVRCMLSVKKLAKPYLRDIPRGLGSRSLLYRTSLSLLVVCSVSLKVVGELKTALLCFKKRDMSIKDTLMLLGSHPG